MMERKLKDSGIPWIGLIPEHWEVRRIKNLYSERTELTETGDEMLLSVSEYYGIAPTKEKTDSDFISRAESLIGYKICHRGDFISNIMLAWKGSFGSTDFNGIVSPAYCVYKPIAPISPKYYHYLFRTDLFKSVFGQYSKGIIESRLRLYSPYFLAIETIVPPVEEQERIARWLDVKCGEIDELIEVEQQMIASLEEYKKAKIREVVFGSDNSSELKDSGISWIGNIPQVWSTRKIKFILKERKERSEDGTEEPLTMSQKHGILPTKEYGDVVNPASSFVGAKIVYSNDLVFNKLKAHLGVFSHSKYNGLVSPDYAVYFSENADVRYYEYLFKTEPYIAEFKKKITGVGSGLSRLYTDDLFSIDGIFPPLPEQQSIADYLDAKCAEITELINVKQEKIDTLKHYRQSLIFEAVTGKTTITQSI